MASTTDNQTEITLKGSVDIVSEFFFYAINSILYQRGKYCVILSSVLYIISIFDNVIDRYKWLDALQF